MTSPSPVAVGVLPEGDLCPVCAMQPVATCRGAYAGCPVLPDAAREAQREPASHDGPNHGPGGPGRQEGQS